MVRRVDQQEPPQRVRIDLPRDSRAGRDQRTAGAGNLLATVRYGDVRWLPGDWTKALFIFERCLIYSAGYTPTFLAWSGVEGLVHESDPGLPRQHEARTWYDVSVDAVGSLDVEQIVGEHHDNWVVWCNEVTAWDLRKGLAASRLRLRLADRAHRKVLWARIPNSFPVIRVALERALGTPSQAR
jgi:hypothetical protein